MLGISLVIMGAIVAVSLLQNSNGNKPNLPVTIRETPEDTLYFLITTHPKPEIRENLQALFLSGEVKFSFRFQDESSGVPLAQFLLADRESIQEKERVEGERPFPVFYFNPTLLLQDRIHSDLAKQSIVLHEYQHYLQWETGRYPEYTFFLGFRFATPEGIKLLFEGELEAHLKGCGMAIEYGVADEMTVCRAYKRDGVAGLRRAVAHDLAQRYENYRTLLQELAAQ